MTLRWNTKNLLFPNVRCETPSISLTYFECITDCQCRKLSNATWHLNKKTLTYTTFLLFFKTGKEFGFVKPVPMTYQVWFWKTKLLLKIFVLAKIISKLSNTSIAETMNAYYIYILKIFVPNLRFASLGSKKLMSTWRLGSGREICRTTQFIHLMNHANTGDILIMKPSKHRCRGLKALPAQQKGIPEGNGASSGSCCHCLLMGNRFPCPWIHQAALLTVSTLLGTLPRSTQEQLCK